jgi:hypothetical protein
VQGGIGEPTGDTLKIGENTVAPLVMKAIQRVTEELAIIHDNIRIKARYAGPIRTFLEPFQRRCRAGIGKSAGLMVKNRHELLSQGWPKTFSNEVESVRVKKTRQIKKLQSSPFSGSGESL